MHPNYLDNGLFPKGGGVLHITEYIHNNNTGNKSSDYVDLRTSFNSVEKGQIRLVAGIVGVFLGLNWSKTPK